MADLSSVGSWYSPANSASWELQLQPNGTARFAVAGPDAGAGTKFVSGGGAAKPRGHAAQGEQARGGRQACGAGIGRVAGGLGSPPLWTIGGAHLVRTYSNTPSTRHSAISSSDMPRNSEQTSPMC